MMNKSKQNYITIRYRSGITLEDIVSKYVNELNEYDEDMSNIKEPFRSFMDPEFREEYALYRIAKFVRIYCEQNNKDFDTVVEKIRKLANFE